MLDATIRGNGFFSDKPIIVRAGGILTDSYALCANADPALDIAGDIPVDHASLITFWADMSFGSTPATSIEIKPIFVSAPIGSGNVIAGKHTGDDVYLGDLASSTPYLIVTSATGGFTASAVGQYLHIVNTGALGRFIPGRYLIAGYTDTNTITLATACAAGGAETGGIGGIACEYQECAIATLAGKSTLTPHYYQFTPAGLDIGTDDQNGARLLWTAPSPAAGIMRVYVKGTGTLTATSLVLGVTLMPPNGR